MVLYFPLTSSRHLLSQNLSTPINTFIIIGIQGLFSYFITYYIPYSLISFFIENLLDVGL